MNDADNESRVYGWDDIFLARDDQCKPAECTSCGTATPQLVCFAGSDPSFLCGACLRKALALVEQLGARSCPSCGEPFTCPCGVGIGT